MHLVVEAATSYDRSSVSNVLAGTPHTFLICSTFKDTSTRIGPWFCVISARMPLQVWHILKISTSESPSRGKSDSTRHNVSFIERRPHKREQTDQRKNKTMAPRQKKNSKKST
jgi:hypothetical protein